MTTLVFLSTLFCLSLFLSFSSFFTLNPLGGGWSSSWLQFCLSLFHSLSSFSHVTPWEGGGALLGSTPHPSTLGTPYGRPPWEEINASLATTIFPLRRCRRMICHMWQKDVQEKMLFLLPPYTAPLWLFAPQSTIAIGCCCPVAVYPRRVRYCHC